MLKLISFFLCVSLILGLGFFGMKNYLDSSVQDESLTTLDDRKEGIEENENSLDGSSGLKELKAQITFTVHDEQLKCLMEKVHQGEDFFWYTKIDSLILSRPEYSKAKLELLTKFKSDQSKTIENLSLLFQFLPKNSFPVEKVSLIKMAQGFHGQAERLTTLAKEILQKEIINKRPEAHLAKSTEEYERALLPTDNMKIPVEAHHLILAQTQKEDSWNVTLECIEMQADPWVRSQMAQTFVKKYPDQKEFIRKDLVQILGENTTRLPASLDSSGRHE